MRKQLLNKFIEGRASLKEQKEVLKWLAVNEANKKYFIGLKNLFVTSTLPDEEAISEEFANFYRKNFLNKEIKKRYSRIFIRVAASLLLFLTIGLNLYQYYLSEHKDWISNELIPVKSLDERKINTLTFYTNKGVKGLVTLPDSSVVWLNSDTRITYPEIFSGNFREVEISGEAFFEVKSNPDTAMIVTTNKGLKIEVLGTKFLIRSYNNDNDAQATLFSGSIKLISVRNRNAREFSRKLKPMESVIIGKNNSIKIIENADTVKSIAWKKGMLIFEDTPLQEVLVKLERWHGAEFIVKDKSILSCKITAQFKSESIVQIMEVIKYCSPIDYTIINKKIILSRR